MADALRREPDVEVKEVDGSRGEFTVLVDDQVAIQKSEHSESLPDINDVVRAIRTAKPMAHSGQ